MLCNIKTNTNKNNVISIPQDQRGLSDTAGKLRCSLGSSFLFIWCAWTREDTVAAAQYCSGLFTQKYTPYPNGWAPADLDGFRLRVNCGVPVTQLACQHSQVWWQWRALFNNYSLQRVSWCFSEWDISKVTMGGTEEWAELHKEVILRHCNQFRMNQNRSMALNIDQVNPC